jgi:LemA protein
MGMLLLVAAGLIFWFVKIYNQLQKLGTAVKQRRADIIASMKKRLDLASRLIDIAKSYGDHEKLTQLSTSENLSSMVDAMHASRRVDQVINQVSGLAMAFPDLKANSAYQQLMSQLHDIETDLQSRRESYNAVVGAYNAYRSSLPQNLFAEKVGFPEAPFFAIDEAGLEVLPEFSTDDGQFLKSTLQKMGDRARNATKQLGSTDEPH